MNKYYQSIIIKSCIFAFAFCIMFFYLLPIESLINDSGDAAETWKVAKTYFDAKPEHSYVMYKGAWAILPNVAFYQLADFFKTDEFLFVKIFNATMFAYITTIGLPFFFKNIFGKSVEKYKVLILTAILFLIIKEYFSFISVDAPSITALLLCSNSAIKIGKRENKNIFSYLLYGCIFAFVTSFSGQFFLSMICVLIYVIIKSDYVSLIKLKKYRRNIMALSLCFIIGFSFVKILDNHFLVTRVQPVRDAGEWLPSGKDWIEYRLTYAMTFSKINVYVPDNRGTAILLQEGKDIEAIKQGAVVYTIRDHFKLALKYPVDFIARWLNRLFLGISIDNNNNSFLFLLFSYTALFINLLVLKKYCIYVKNLLQPKSLLIIAWILPSLIPIVLHVELRYFMSLHILIFSIAIIDRTLWDIFKEFKNCVTNRSQIKFNQIKINYSFLAYLIFISLCFMIYATQVELLGPNSSILFTL